MTLFSKAGILLKQSALQNSGSCMLNSIRWMSSTKLFVGGLSFGTDNQQLKDAFSGFGEVVEARVISDRETGRSRGFGFVDFTDAESASQAISAMDGQELQGRSIRVNLANDRPPRPAGGGYGGGGYNRGGGGGYGGGGYGGGGGGYQRSQGGYGGNDE